MADFYAHNRAKASRGCEEGIAGKFFVRSAPKRREQFRNYRVNLTRLISCLQHCLQGNMCSGDTFGDKQNHTVQGFPIDLGVCLQISKKYVFWRRGNGVLLICTMAMLSGYLNGCFYNVNASNPCWIRKFGGT